MSVASHVAFLKSISEGGSFRRENKPEESLGNNTYTSFTGWQRGHPSERDGSDSQGSRRVWGIGRREEGGGRPLPSLFLPLLLCSLSFSFFFLLLFFEPRPYYIAQAVLELVALPLLECWSYGHIPHSEFIILTFESRSICLGCEPGISLH